MMICPHCGDEARLDVLDLFLAERSFMLDACCETAHDVALEEIADDPRAVGRFLEKHTGIACRGAFADAEGGGMYGNAGIVIDYGLALRPVTWAAAAAWVGARHRHNAAPCGWRWGHAVANGPELVGVATVGRPVARCLDGARLVEVTRVCVDDRLPSYLVRDACSMLYGAAAREAKRRGFERALTYTREGERATTLVAAGWTPTHVVKIDRRGWAREGRERGLEERCRKLRWERGLSRAARADVAARELRADLVDRLTGR